MSSQVSGTLNIQLLASVINQLGIGTAQFPLQLPNLVGLNFTNGTAGIGKVNQLFAVQGTLAAAASTTLDLYTMGGISDPVGNAYTQAIIKILIIMNLGLVGATNPTPADTLIVGAAGSTPWTAFLNSTGTGTINGGGFVILGDPSATGYAVPSGSGANVLKLLSGASANTITYNIIGLGATA